MKLIDTLKARWLNACYRARATALGVGRGAVDNWRAELLSNVAEVRWAARLDPRSPVSALLALAQHYGGVTAPEDASALRGALRNIAAVTPAGAQSKLPVDIRSAIQHFDYATDTPVTPGPVMRVLLSARLIYRAWRQDV